VTKERVEMMILDVDSMFLASVSWIDVVEALCRRFCVLSIGSMRVLYTPRWLCYVL
jgi:hypothetical protein